MYMTCAERMFMLCWFAEKKCAKPEGVDNAKILPTDNYLLGSYIKYECNDNGHVLLGNAVRKCVVDSLNSVHWAGSQPLCYGN